MYYPDDLIEEVRSRNDIVDVISGYIRLSKKGSNHFGLCPFHNEKSPSFSVSENKQMFHCFGCQVSGNVFTFVMKYENYNFSEAVKLLADRVGIKLPEVEYSGEMKERESLKKQMLEANKEAAKYYYLRLKDASGKEGYNYFKERGLSDETITKFGLGYSVPSFDALYRHLKQAGFSDKVLKDVGLCQYSERGGVIDKFRNRVMFPIMDVNYRVIGFGGRVLGDEKPKYLNTNETLVFDKGRNLYGLNIARSARKKNIIICEGYMDVIALHQAGFNQAVASLGTALTSGQASLMRRYADNVLICYDSDTAGTNAALKAIKILREAGFSTKVIDMKPYKDPDEFIKNLGAEEFQKRIDNALNSFYFDIDITALSYDLADPDGKTAFSKEIASKFLVFKDDVEIDSYIEGVCKRYKFNEESLRSLIKKQALKSEGISSKEPPKSTINSKKADDNYDEKTQRVLLSWIIDEPKIYESVKEYIEIEDFSEGIYRDVATLMFEGLENGTFNPSSVIARFTEEEEQVLVGSLFNTSHEEVDDENKSMAIKQLLIRLKSLSYDRNLNSSNEDPNALMKMLDNRKKLEQLEKIQIKI